jgi:hypothetical protein
MLIFKNNPYILPKLFKMRYLKIFNYVMMSCLLVFMSSCHDDLNTTLQDETRLTTDEFFQQEDAYTKLIAGVYGNLNLTGVGGPGDSNITGIDAGTSQYGRALMNLQCFSTDEAIWTYENDPGIAGVQRMTSNAENVIVRGAFGRIMGGVAFANNFLRESTEGLLDERGITGAERDLVLNEYRPEARFVRALAYYHMLDLFGKANFVTEDLPLGEFESPMIEGQELFDYIEAELLEIEPLMNDSRSNYARADKGTVRMLLAKLYLNANTYLGTNDVTYFEKALQYSELVINDGYTILPDYDNLFRADNDVNGAQNEIIFAVPADGIESQSFGPMTVMTNGAVGSVEQNGQDLGVTAGGWGGAIRVSSAFADKFEGEEFANDVRNTILKDGRTPGIIDITNPAQGFALTKYSDVRSDGTQDNDQTFASIDYPMFRLADAYLMYAEAHLRGGGGSPTQALNYVNALRERANQGSSAANITLGDLTLNFIIDERARELYWEFHRRQDLRRFGLYTGAGYTWAFKGGSPSGIPTPSFRDVYPIPNQSLTVNPNLTQNPGY